MEPGVGDDCGVARFGLRAWSHRRPAEDGIVFFYDVSDAPFALVSGGPSDFTTSVLPGREDALVLSAVADQTGSVATFPAQLAGERALVSSLRALLC